MAQNVNLSESIQEKRMNRMKKLDE